MGCQQQISEPRKAATHSLLQTLRFAARPLAPRYPTCSGENNAYRKLVVLDAAELLQDLQSPLGNRLEKLAHEREGQYSIRTNDQWRVCFRWQGRDAYDVEIADYH